MSNTLAYSGRDKVTKPQRFVISVTAAGGAPSSFCVATALSRTDGRILTVFFLKMLTTTILKKKKIQQIVNHFMAEYKQTDLKANSCFFCPKKRERL